MTVMTCIVLLRQASHYTILAYYKDDLLPPPPPSDDVDVVTMKTQSRETIRYCEMVNR